MSDEKVYSVPQDWAQHAWVDNDKYLQMYQRSIDDPEGFWREHGHRIHWIEPFTKVKNTNFTRRRHDQVVRGRRAQRQPPTAWTATWPPARTRPRSSGSPTTPRRRPATSPIARCYDETCRMANALKKMGAKKGDRITIYMPMIPEAAYAMLACARIGAIHSVVFGGFSPDCAGQPHPGLRFQHRHHRRRGPARRPQGAAEGQRRRGASNPARP